MAKNINPRAGTGIGIWKENPVGPPEKISITEVAPAFGQTASNIQQRLSESDTFSNIKNNKGGIVPNVIVPGSPIKVYDDKTGKQVDQFSPLVAVPNSATKQQETTPPKENEVTLPLPNMLSEFASYNYIFTLGCLTNDELNRPDATYRKKEPSVLILRSGGGAGSKKVLSAFETEDRKLEFFIDDVEIMSFATPNDKVRLTGHSTLDFKVVEPYSLGLFPQVLELAAVKAGHLNYLQAPFCLTIDFVGWDSNGNSKVVEEARKVIVFNWTYGEFNFEGGMSTYSITGVPYNELALSDAVQTLPVDVEVTGRTVNEVCQTGIASLTTAINTHLLKGLDKNNLSEPDDYVVVFPNDRASITQNIEVESDEARATDKEVEDVTELGVNRKFDVKEALQTIVSGTWYDNATDAESFLQAQRGFTLRRSNISESIKQTNEIDDNVNVIGSAKIPIGSPYEKGNLPPVPVEYALDKETGTLKKGSVIIDPDKRSIRFKKGTKIQKAIEELVLISEYGQKLGKNAKPDEKGMVDWFRIETQVFNLSNKEQEKKINRPPRVYVYLIVPYKVHISKFAVPNKAVPGYEVLESEVPKKYDYLYTGKNDDILDFDLQFKNTFFQALAPDLGNNGLDSKTSENATAADEEPDKEVSDTGTDNSESGQTMENVPTSGDSDAVGAVRETKALSVARRFNEAIVNSPSDLITTTMTIWGDPFYLSDSGMGNYISKETENFNVNGDRAVDTQNGQVDLLINFRTPIDIGPNGLYSFPQEFANVDNFSGLYFMTTLIHSFRQGQFTQELTLVRRLNYRLKEKATTQDEVGLFQDANKAENQTADAIVGGLYQEELNNFLNETTNNPPSLKDVAGSIQNATKAQITKEDEINKLNANNPRGTFFT